MSVACLYILASLTQEISAIHSTFQMVNTLIKLMASFQTVSKVYVQAHFWHTLLNDLL